MPKLSAGLLLYRITDGDVEVLIGHPGGPFWARKDEGAWSIPKGEYVEGEDPWTVAQREFEEELGKAPPDGPRIDFAPLKQPSGKIITAVYSSGAIGRLIPQDVAGNNGTYPANVSRGTQTMNMPAGATAGGANKMTRRANKI